MAHRLYETLSFLRGADDGSTRHLLDHEAVAQGFGFWRAADYRHTVVLSAKTAKTVLRGRTCASRLSASILQIAMLSFACDRRAPKLQEALPFPSPPLNHGLHPSPPFLTSPTPPCTPPHPKPGIKAWRSPSPSSLHPPSLCTSPFPDPPVYVSPPPLRRIGYPPPPAVQQFRCWHGVPCCQGFVVGGEVWSVFSAFANNVPIV